MYIFYGLEIPKTWDQWESEEPVTLKKGLWEVDVPKDGGEPVLRKNKAVIVEGYELSFYRYPAHDVESVWVENSAVLGFLICELDAYTDPSESLEKYSEWRTLHAGMTNFDVILETACKAFDFNFIKPKLVTAMTTQILTKSRATGRSARSDLRAEKSMP